MMTVIGIEMCSNRRYLYVITMVSVNINGERRHIHTYPVQYSHIAVFFTLLTELIHEIRAQYSAYC
jgi:hypothetical protein